MQLHASQSASSSTQLGALLIQPHENSPILQEYLLMVHDELLDQVCVIFDGLELQTKSNDCIISQEIFRVILLQLLTSPDGP